MTTEREYVQAIYEEAGFHQSDEQLWNAVSGLQELKRGGTYGGSLADFRNLSQPMGAFNQALAKRGLVDFIPLPSGPTADSVLVRSPRYKMLREIQRDKERTKGLPAYIRDRFWTQQMVDDAFFGRFDAWLYLYEGL